MLSRAATPAVKKTLARLIASSPDLPSADAALASSIKSGLAANDAAAPAKRQGIAARFEQDVQNDAAVMPLFKMRAYLYSRIHVIYMSLRNLVFKIHTDTPRPIPETTYHASLQLLELSLRYARSLGIGMVLYLAPVRPIQPNPTVPWIWPGSARTSSGCVKSIAQPVWITAIWFRSVCGPIIRQIALRAKPESMTMLISLGRRTNWLPIG